MAKNFLEEAFLEAVESKVSEDGYIVPVDPFAPIKEASDEDIKFVADAFTTNAMRDIFKEERESIKNMMYGMVDDLKKQGYQSDKELEIKEEELDALMRELYGF